MGRPCVRAPVYERGTRLQGNPYMNGTLFLRQPKSRGLYGHTHERDFDTSRGKLGGQIATRKAGIDWYLCDFLHIPIANVRLCEVIPAFLEGQSRIYLVI